MGFLELQSCEASSYAFNTIIPSNRGPAGSGRNGYAVEVGSRYSIAVNHGWGQTPCPPSLRFGGAMRVIGAFGETLGFSIRALNQCKLRIRVEDGRVETLYQTTVRGVSERNFELDRWYYIEHFVEPGNPGRQQLVVDGEVWLDVTANFGVAVKPTDLLDDTFYAPSKGTSGGTLYFDDLYAQDGRDEPLGDITVYDAPVNQLLANDGWTPGNVPLSPAVPWKSTAVGQSVSFAATRPEGVGDVKGAVLQFEAQNSGMTTLRMAYGPLGAVAEPVSVSTTVSKYGVALGPTPAGSPVAFEVVSA